MAPLAFRPLARADLPLLQRWLSEPHVLAWWREPLDLAGVRVRYEPRIDGAEPTRVFVIEAGGRPAGWIQWYRWSDYPAHAAQLRAAPEDAGLDLAIGEPDLLGRGIGTAALRAFAAEVIFAAPDVAAILADPEEANARSLRAFEKAGFSAVRTVTLRGESAPRRIMRLDRPG